MTTKEVTATSGRMDTLSANTQSEKIGAAGYACRSISVTVTTNLRANRVLNINQRLQGRPSRNVNTSK